MTHMLSANPPPFPVRQRCRLFAVLHVPTTSHPTVTFSTERDGASLVDPEQVDAWLAHSDG
jgi:hypothetical protein